MQREKAVFSTVNIFAVPSSCTLVLTENLPPSWQHNIEICGRWDNELKLKYHSRGYFLLTSFPGLSTFQILINWSMQKQRDLSHEWCLGGQRGRDMFWPISCLSSYTSTVDKLKACICLTGLISICEHNFLGEQVNLVELFLLIAAFFPYFETVIRWSLLTLLHTPMHTASHLQILV